MYCGQSLHKFIDKVLKALLMPGVVSWGFVRFTCFCDLFRCSNMLRGLEFNHLEIKNKRDANLTTANCCLIKEWCLCQWACDFCRNLEKHEICPEPPTHCLLIISNGHIKHFEVILCTRSFLRPFWERTLPSARCHIQQLDRYRFYYLLIIIIISPSLAAPFVIENRISSD